jgi:hypothetical protein
MCKVEQHRVERECMRTAAKNMHMHMQPCYIHANTGVPQTAVMLTLASALIWC